MCKRLRTALCTHHDLLSLADDTPCTPRSPLPTAVVMALSLNSTRAAHSHAASRSKVTCARTPRTRVVTVRAGLGDALNYVGQAFMKIFSPPQDNVDSWSGTNNPFSGKIKHSAKRPFEDNYVAGGQKYSSQEPAAAEAAAAPQQGGGESGVIDYVGGALERVVGHNFTGDENEPTTTTGSVGWKGDIHDRKTEGFHSRRV